MLEDRSRQTSRQRLGQELRRFRRQAGPTQREVAAAMDWSPSKVMRIESGTVAVSTNDLRALLRHYHVDSGAVTTLVEAAREVKKSDNGFPPGAGIQAAYLQNESIAARIRQYEPLLIPVLLQTEEYLRAAAADTLRREGAELEWLVRRRLRRQRLLTRAVPARLSFVLDEAVLHRQVGHPGTMARQLAHLADLGGRPDISIRVVPFAAGAYTGLLGPFVLMDVDPAGSLLYLNGRDGIRMKDDVEVVGGYRDHFRQLEQTLAVDLPG